jgi:transcriptional regulator with XRE-family HTH domain
VEVLVIKSLSTLRKNENLTQKELANILHVDQTTISTWENDKVVPTGEMLCKIADFFNCTTDYLLGRTENTQNGIEKSAENTEEFIYSINKEEQDLTREEIVALKGLLVQHKNEINKIYQDEEKITYSIKKGVQELTHKDIIALKKLIK